MEIVQSFLEADTRTRLLMMKDRSNREALSALLGKLAYDQLSEVATRTDDHLAGASKNVIFVPGIMGSLLMNRSLSGVWWLDVRTRDCIDRLALSPDGTREADPKSEIAPATADPSYMPYLAAASMQDGLGHEIFAYDWRKSLFESTNALRDVMLKLYAENGQNEINFVAHSMGGLMVRATLMKHGDELWPKVGKIIFVGTPHYGSCAIAGYLKNHLWGFELLALLGQYLSRATLRSLWGFITLLPAPAGIYPGTRRSPDSDLIPTWTSEDPNDPYIHPCSNFDFYSETAWKLGLDPTSATNLQRILDATRDFYTQMYQAHGELSQDLRNRMVVIAGVGYQTLFRLAYKPGFLGLWEKTEKIVNRVNNNPHREGDGRVPLASAELEYVGGIRYVRGVHGALTNIPVVYNDIFRFLNGKAMELPTTVGGALEQHLGPQSESEAPDLDGTSIAGLSTTGSPSQQSDDPGLWLVDQVSTERLEELNAMLAANKLPAFGRLSIL
jgi:pimeloyl-ACP methyl ester carboxylesterase